MQQFADLTRAGQVRRMRQLAEVALSSYELGAIQLTPLTHFFNTTFRVDALPRNGERTNHGDRYVIRIHRPGSQDATTIQSELTWLLALRHKAGLVVPEPVHNRTGSLIMLAATPRIPEARHCVVFRWVDGRFLRDQLGEKELVRVGMFMARLHQHAEQFVPPAGFYRKAWDYEGLRGGVLGTDLVQSWAHLSHQEHILLDEVGQRVQRTMHALGTDRSVFGMIHADFYERNYLFSHGEVHAIDFDGCGWGHYLFDIGVTFSTLQQRSTYHALRQAFLSGYRCVRPLSVEHEALIDTFIAGRLMCHVLWLAAHLDEPAYGARAARRIQLELVELQHFLAACPV